MERFNLLFSAMSEGVAVHEMIYDTTGEAVDYRILSVNPKFEFHTGLSKDKAIGSKATELYATDPPPYLDTYSRVVSTKTPESFETYFATMKRHFSISAVSTTDGKFMTIFTDITERKLNEEKLQYFSDIVNNISDAIIATDMQFRIVSINPAAETLYGWRSDEIQ